MTYVLRQTAAPSVEPVSLAEAKAHVQQDQAVDDALITRLIVAARQYFETMTGRALIEQTWTATFAEWPSIYGVSEDDAEAPLSMVVPVARAVSSVEIVKLPFISVEGVTADGDAWTEFTTLKTTRGARLKLTGIAPAGEIVVTFKCGYGATAATVPSDISYAILMLVATFYEHRGVMPITPTGFQIAAQRTPGFDAILHRYQVMS